jgi:stage III sporulation protein AH
MINKQKLWFLTLFSIILVLSIYYVAMPNESFNNIIKKEQTSSSKSKVSINEDDALAALRVEDDESVLAEIGKLQDTLQSAKSTTEEKNNAYEKMQSINLNKGKEDSLEELILKTYKLKSFIKINDDKISVTISSKDGSYEKANKIIRTIQKEFTEKKYITVKYQ